MMKYLLLQRSGRVVKNPPSRQPFALGKHGGDINFSLIISYRVEHKAQNLRNRRVSCWCLLYEILMLHSVNISFTKYLIL